MTIPVDIPWCQCDEGVGSDWLLLTETRQWRASLQIILATPVKHSGWIKTPAPQHPAVNIIHIHAHKFIFTNSYSWISHIHSSSSRPIHHVDQYSQLW